MQQEIKVLFISVRADIGGGPKQLLDLLENKPSWIKAYTAIPYNQDYSDKILKASSVGIEVPFRRFSIKSFLKILIKAKKEKIQIIHSHGRGAGIYSRLLKLFGLKVVHTFHGVHNESGLSGQTKLWIDRILSPLTNLFINVSNSEREKALRLKVADKHRSQIIFNGVKLQEDRKEAYLPNTKVAMLGRLSHPKGYDILIPYIEKFCQDHNKMEFEITIAGDGEDKEKIKDLLAKSPHASKRIRLIGKTLDPINFLKDHSSFLSFSRFEGLPISVLEAMSIGLPCLLSNVTGNKDVVKTGSEALLFNLKDNRDFNKKFYSLLTDSELQLTLSKSAQKTIKDHFSVEKMARKTFEIYKKLI